MNKVKITVLKRMGPEDVFGDDMPCKLEEFFSSKCPRLNVGDEFLVTEDGACPGGFCGWAFADIHPIITHLRFGGTLRQCGDRDWVIACCTDGVRPVFFSLEAVKE